MMALLPRVLVALVAFALVFAVATTIVRLTRADRHDDGGARTVQVTRVLAGLFMIVVTIGTLVEAVHLLVAERLSLDVPVDGPVTENWPTLPAGTDIQMKLVTDMTATIERVTVDVEGLDLVVRGLLAAGTVLEGLAILAIAALIFRACRSLQSESEVFTAALARAASITAAVMLVAGIVSQVLLELGRVSAAVAAFTWSSAEQDCPTTCPDIDTLWPEPAIEATLSFWPIGAGLALAVLALLLRRALVLQQDSRGLV